jgi:FtsZ-binding cell division protein ZapB
MPDIENIRPFAKMERAIDMLRLLQMSEADIKAGRVLSVEQAREAIKRSRRERIEKAKSQSGESRH